MHSSEHSFKAAITRLPGTNLADGLTRADLGRPSLPLALEQHRRYCEVLRQCGLEVTVLADDPAYPDGTFVEDTAVIAAGAAILTRPGAISRRGEAAAIRAPLLERFGELAEIIAPGTLDGGDICEAGRHVFIGLSQRTNAEGVAQLSSWLHRLDYTSTTVDIRDLSSILHLKSGIAAIGDERLLLIDELVAHPAFEAFDHVRVDPGEAYAANAIRVNDHVLIASGFPLLEARLAGLGYRTIALDMSEFAKLDGGLSCLSLRC